MSGIRSVLVVGSAVAALVLVGGATAREAAPVTPIGASLSSPGAVARYLTSLGIDPKRVVVQRGARNYAGSFCPGAGWTCTPTSHPVVQIVSAGGHNVFRCGTAGCAVVQISTAALATNTASCIRTTGVTQACSITQSGAAANQAVVVETALKTTGLTQSASQTAQIVQQATGTGNGNTACVLQTMTLSSSSDARSSAVTESLDGHQSISIKQDSTSGPNVVSNATSGGACDSATPMTQSQTISQTATSSAGITQNENATGSGPNSLIDIEQNQSTPGALGTNVSKFNQSASLTAQAYTPAGPVSQTQSSAGGGLKATVNQVSTGVSTSTATQTETEISDADKSTTDVSLPTGTLTQTQYGPVRCCSNQASNPADTFNVTQTSTQDNDTHQNQTNTVAADCSTSGNCTVTQTTSVDGNSTSNIQTGSNVSTSINCTGTTCTKPTITFDGSPGTGVPPAMLGPYTMTPFGADGRPLGNDVSNVTDPAGTVGFTPALNHTQIGVGWATWSNGYTGDVYDSLTATDKMLATITLPAGTKAFYFYVEPNTFANFAIQATAQDGTTSGPITVQGNAGAQYFGFYGTGGATLSSITVTSADTTGFAVGEFGIAP